ncbi:MAG: hypothetical protein K2M06_09500 [Muribaculaceae bacterium]|nr:hypothetical protein [Muribaculaceae bacterium]
MKKALLTIVSALFLSSGLAASAQGTITLTTSAEPGTKVSLLPNAVSATTPITIDFGDGIGVKYTVDPKIADWQRWIESEIKGPNITISGNLTELTFTEAQLTSAKLEGMSHLKKLNLEKNELESFELTTITPLEELRLSYNKIYNSPSQNSTLSLEYAGETLKRLSIAYNEQLQCLDLRYLQVLEDFSANNCPDFASVFICLPEESRDCLKYLNLNECALAHFYPVNLPSLQSLHLASNHLMTEYDDSPFSLGNYPKLRYLTLSHNKGIHSVDVSECPEMEQLYIDDCNFTSIDISACPELNTLNIADNKIKSLDLGNNKKISALMVNGNPLTELNLDLVPAVKTLNVSDTKISRLDLMKSYFLDTFRASNTLLEFLDFNGLQADRVRTIDLRNNPNFTYESMAYTLRTLPVARKAYSTNLFLEGSNAEKADIDYVTSTDMGWICDVDGDGSAQFTPLSISFEGAQKTGEKKVGELERLYPYFGLGLNYDLEVMSTNGGKFVVAQWKPIYFQSIKDATDGSAYKGVPICVYAYPEEGKTFRSVTVNGKEINSPWFIISEDATVKVNFSNELSSITMTVPANQDMSFRVNTVNSNESVWVDWGTGQRTEYPGQRAYATGSNDLVGSRIDGKAVGTTVTVYGNLAGLDINGFGDVAADFGLWDNHVTALDLSNAPDLKILTAYWNPIQTIDLSHNPLLEVLDVSYTAIEELNLANLPNLMSLEAYSAGLEEDGIRPLKSIDLSGLPILQLLNLKNNRLEALDLTSNPYLRWVDICGNNFKTIDLSQNPIIEELNLMNGKLESIDLSKQTKLVDLNVDGNELTALDLTHNKDLELLMASNNHIKVLDLNGLKNLQRVYINGNGLTAAELNAISYSLPQRIDRGDETTPGMAVSWNFCVYQGMDREPNDYLGYDSSIAYDRAWIPSHSASNSGCEHAYLDLLSALHGTYTVTDATGHEYFTGSTVEKWLPLTIHPTPENGYKFYSFQLNDDDPILDNEQFLMPGVYTKLHVNFVKTSGIEAAEAAEGLNIRAIAGGIEVNAAEATAVAVYTPAGALVATAQAEGTTTLALAPGFYIVRAGALAQTVAVK